MGFDAGEVPRGMHGGGDEFRGGHCRRGDGSASEFTELHCVYALVLGAQPPLVLSTGKLDTLRGLSCRLRIP